MSTKWKKTIIILSVILLIGLTGKIVIDRLFSMLVLSQLDSTGFDFKGTLSNNEDINKEHEISGYNGDKNVNDSNDENDNYNDNININTNKSEITFAEREDTKKITEEANKSNERKNNTSDNSNINSDSDSDSDSDSSTNIGNNRNAIIGKSGKAENVDTEEDMKRTEKKIVEEVGKKDIEEDVGNDVKDDGMGSINKDSADTDLNGKNNNNKENTSNIDEDTNTIKVTDEKIARAEKQVSTSDKLLALGIVLKKLKPSDIEKLLGMLRKGKLSQDDINTAKKIIKEKVTEEEKNILKGLFNKYEYLIE